MKELFYSNGVDIFGPVSLHEFCQNRYYKSTLIWYEGLSGWINIGDCEDLRHLIGTMPTPALDTAIPHSLPNLTPPLSKVQTGPAASGNRKYVALAGAMVIILLGLITYYFNHKVNPVDHSAVKAADTVPLSQPTIDTAATLQAEMLKKVKAEAEMKTYRMNWEKFITTVPNDYKQKDIGGIDDLKVLVKNNSPYTIDKVVVKVSYVKANGSNYQTEIMEFDNIEPNTNKELFAPKSDRGVKVNCSILSVRSDAMNLCLDKREKGFARKTGEDPYLCR